MSTSETRAKDPFSVPLTPADIRTVAFPDGNYGYGVFVEPTKDGRWRLTPAPEPEEQKERRAKLEPVARQQEKRAARLKERPVNDVHGTVLGILKGHGLEVTEVPVQRNDAMVVTLDEVVLSKHELPDRWTVAGYWNLAGAWRVRGTFADWPFGGERIGRAFSSIADPVVPRRGPLVACLPDGTMFYPRIPTFAEMEAHILAQKLRASAWECGCGQVHADGGGVVGLCIEEHAFLGKVMRDVRLIVREDGHQRFRGSLVEEVLDLRVCALLKHVEPGGAKPSVSGRLPGSAREYCHHRVFVEKKA